MSKPLYTLKDNQQLPRFDAANAYAQIEKQVSFGSRNPNSKGHATGLAYLQNELKKYADEIQLQPFSYTGYNGEKLDLTNIIGKFNTAAKSRILLTAHWDSRPWADQEKDSAKHKIPILGANDGASGVGVLLEIARILKIQKVDYGVDIIFFDGEDYGRHDDLSNFCLGSKYFSSRLPANYSPMFAVLLDLVGDKEAVFMKEGYSYQFAPDVVNMVWGLAARSGATQFVNQVGPAIYDDHIPLNQAGIRTIDIIDIDLVGGQTPNKRRNYWHTLNDTMENISKETLQSVGDVLVNFIYSLQFYN
ncbi:MAG: M28 family peptidase [Ignavibacteriaceae bacterium]|nr:M28 family peptidase [Ignavibacteriaceae bacterium]